MKKQNDTTHTQKRNKTGISRQYSFIQECRTVGLAAPGHISDCYKIQIDIAENSTKQNIFLSGISSAKVSSCWRTQTSTCLHLYRLNNNHVDHFHNNVRQVDFQNRNCIFCKHFTEKKQFILLLTSFHRELTGKNCLVQSNTVHSNTQCSPASFPR